MYIAIHQYLDDWLKKTVVQGEVSPGQTENTPEPTNGLSHQLWQIKIDPHSTAELCSSTRVGKLTGTPEPA